MLVSLSALLITLVPAAARPTPLRVACVGDSMTHGTGLPDRERLAYPAQLAELLGPGYQVLNSGAEGASFFDQEVSTSTSEDLNSWRPHIVVVLMGTDGWRRQPEAAPDPARPWVLRAASSYLEDLREQVPAATLLLCTPPRPEHRARGGEAWSEEERRGREQHHEQLRRALADPGLDTLDVDRLDLSLQLRARDYLEAARPSPLGAARLASRIAEAVVRARAPVLPVWGDPSAVPEEPREERFQGHRGQRFTLQMPGRDGVEGVLVAPDRPAAGYPWIWRARFFGHEPDLDRELLSRGYHLAYCDVSGLFGADEALERWDRFYEHCVGLGLSRRVTLEGMSRGGLPVLNWAARHPERVEAIYLDNPVCDFRSWPGGNSGKRSDADWEECLGVHGLTEEQAATYDRMPLDRLEPVAKARVPLFIVLGSADEVVPPAENGEALAARYRELGGPVEVWRKPGVGHHPHGLHPVDPLLRRLLQVTGRGRNPATRPVPSAEYRGHPAGWGGGTWWGQLDRLRELAVANPDAELVFLGDSITQGLTGSADRVARPGGPRAIDRFHGERDALSLGLSGDRTEHLLYRIEHGALATLDPEVIVLAIGVNNVNAAGHTGVETAEGLVAVVDALADVEPQAHVLICGPFPAGPTPDDPRRVALDQVHERAALLGARDAVTTIDLRPLFLDETGRPNERMGGDHIHVTAAGRAAWMEAIEPTVARLLTD